MPDLSITFSKTMVEFEGASGCAVRTGVGGGGEARPGATGLVC
jgi:hypothetical protein